MDAALAQLNYYLQNTLLIADAPITMPDKLTSVDDIRATLECSNTSKSVQKSNSDGWPSARRP